MSTNMTIMIGRLTRDPKLMQSASGTSYCNVTLAIDRAPDKNGNKVTDFPSIKLWKSQAENAAKHLHQGSLIRVIGTVRTGQYQDRNSGETVYTQEIHATDVEYLANYGNSSKGENVAPAPAPAPTPAPAASPAPQQAAPAQPQQSTGYTYEPDDFEEEETNW